MSDSVPPVRIPDGQREVRAVPLMAGAFSAVPVKVGNYGGRAYTFLDAGNQQCWSDPNGRVLLYKIEDVLLVLTAHRYELDPQTMVVTPIAPPAKDKRRGS